MEDPIKRLLIVALVGIAVSGRIAAAAVAPSKPSQILNLFNSGTLCGGGPNTVVDQVLNPDGTTATFAIPAGQVLIVTSVDWVSASVTPNRHWEFVLGTTSAGFTLGGGAQSDADGFVSGTLVIPGGLVVKSGVKFCPDIEHAGTSEPVEVRVHGFLTKDR
jgi:hypothetical protein